MNGSISAAEANRRFYADYAADYDELESCAASDRDISLLRARVASAVGLLEGEVKALDAGGGTGRVATILVELGINPLVLDVSAEMVQRWKTKARDLGVSSRTRIGTVEDVLCDRSESWDLIVFSSVLHHLEDPLSTVRSAAHALAPGGVLLTVQDPTLGDAITRRLRRIDWVSSALVHHPGLVRSAISARLRPKGSGQNDHVAKLAERHAVTGLDDRMLAKALIDEGMTVVDHLRLYDARWAAVRALFRATRRPSIFSLTAQKRPSA